MWWNDSYLFRRNITLSVIDAIPAGHPVTISFPTAILYTLNKVREDLQDIVVINDSTPIPSNVSFVGTNIQVEFNLSTTITSGTNNDYDIYYGNKNLIDTPTLASYSPNPWPLSVNAIEGIITYRRPDQDWSNGETTVTGAKATFSFTGSAVRLNADTGLDAGIVSVQLDNNPSLNIDLYANTTDTSIAVQTYTNLTPSIHTLRIVNTGQANKASSSTKLSINSIDYLGYITAADNGEEIGTLNWTTNIGGAT